MDVNKSLMRGLKLVDLAIMFASFSLSALAALLLAGSGVDTLRDFLAIRISVGNVMLVTVFPVLWFLLFCEEQEQYENCELLFFD
jgi:hypothetical protein